MRRFVLVFLLLVTCQLHTYAQSLSAHRNPTKDQSSLRVAILIGHTFIPVAHTHENILIPSWGLDLEYWFNHTWGLGWHNDLEIESFIIQRPGDESIEREYPLVTTLDLLYKPAGGLVLLIGPGYEIARGQDYLLMRLGLEYEIELSHHWDLAPSFFFDSREGSFHTWSLGLGVGYRW